MSVGKNINKSSPPFGMHHRSGGCCNRITGPGRDADTAKGDTIGKEQKEPSPTRLHTRNVPEPERQRKGTRREVPGMAKDWYRCQREGFRLASTRMWFGISFVSTTMDHFQRENLVVGFESFPSLFSVSFKRTPLGQDLLCLHRSVPFLR